MTEAQHDLLVKNRATSDVAGWVFDPLTPAENEAYQGIRAWLLKQAGIHYPDKKKNLLTHRLKKLCARQKISGGLIEIATRLTQTSEVDLHLQVLIAASTNHTYFYREPVVLTYFKEQIIPALPQDQEIRIWSAAASEGDEAYTICMMFADVYGVAWVKRYLRVLGTDISMKVLTNAEPAIYPAKRLEALPDGWKARYFTPVAGNRYQVIGAFREVCLFRRLNLKMGDYPFQQLFDVVFCRNVLYYFDKPHQTMTVNNIYRQVKAGGWLLTSVTESLRDLSTHWKPLIGGVYQK